MKSWANEENHKKVNMLDAMNVWPVLKITIVIRQAINYTPYNMHSDTPEPFLFKLFLTNSIWFIFFISKNKKVFMLLQQMNTQYLTDVKVTSLPRKMLFLWTSSPSTS